MSKRQAFRMHMWSAGLLAIGWLLLASLVGCCDSTPKTKAEKQVDCLEQCSDWSCRHEVVCAACVEACKGL